MSHASSSIVSLCLAALSAGCGGGGDATAVGAALAVDEAPRAAPRRVQLEGCVADGHELPRGGSRVRVLAADGRLLGHAVSDRAGVFRLLLAPHQTVRVAIEDDPGLHLEVPLAAADLTVGACLQDRTER